jgi:RES domain-containing protein
MVPQRCRRELAVKIKPNPRYESFLAQLRHVKHAFAPWEGVVFRATPLPYARAVKLLDGRGSLKVGGRWLAAGTFPAVNLATSQEAALKESNATFTYYNFAPSDVRPKVLVGVRLRLARVLDLVDPRGLRTLPWVGLEELLAEDWRKVNDAGHEAQSQALGRPPTRPAPREPWPHPPGCRAGSTWSISRGLWPVAAGWKSLGKENWPAG